jgi:folate-dependent tRNA-U54 methylase TrmFO/GidA
MLANCGSVSRDSKPTADEPPVDVEVTVSRSVESRETPPVEGADIQKSKPKGEAVVTASPSTLPDLPQPVNELIEKEYRWSQLLARDAIAPIYDPQFVPADQASYGDHELVIGVEINGEAKAYAVGPLNSPEMVNDIVGGVPVLVTW